MLLNERLIDKRYTDMRLLNDVDLMYVGWLM
jgi:hypothetical protein